MPHKCANNSVQRNAASVLCISSPPSAASIPYIACVVLRFAFSVLVRTAKAPGCRLVGTRRNRKEDQRKAPHRMMRRTFVGFGVVENHRVSIKIVNAKQESHWQWPWWVSWVVLTSCIRESESAATSRAHKLEKSVVWSVEYVVCDMWYMACFRSCSRPLLHIDCSNMSSCQS